MTQSVNRNDERYMHLIFCESMLIYTISQVVMDRLFLSLARFGP